MSELAHVVRTHHIDTGAVEMMCGERRAAWEDPSRDSAMCGGCAVELVNLLKHRLDEQAGEAAAIRRVLRREIIEQTEQIEVLTDECRALRKQVKKARKAAEKG